MEVIDPRPPGRWRGRAAGAVAAVVVAAAVAGGYLGLHRGSAGDSVAGNPPARAEATMAYDPDTDDVVMFGGAGAGGSLLDDTWLWNGVSWSEAMPAQSPPARYMAQMAWDPQSHRVILLGGTGGSGCNAQDGAVVSSGPAPGACTQLQDAWAWDGTTWNQVDLGQGPDQVGGHSLAGADLATDPADGQLVLLTSPLPAASVPPAVGGGSGQATAIAGSAGAATGSTGAGSTEGGSNGAGSAGTGSTTGCSICPGLPAGSGANGADGRGIACPMIPATQGSSGSNGSAAICLAPCALAGGSGSATPGCPISCDAGGSGAAPAIACPVCPSPTSGDASSPQIACPICPPAMTSGAAASPAIACPICPPVESGTASSGAGSAITCSSCSAIGCFAGSSSDTWTFDGTSFKQVSGSGANAPTTGGDLAWFPGQGVLADLIQGPQVAMGVDCTSGEPCLPTPPRVEMVSEWNGRAWTAETVATGDVPPGFAAAPVTDLSTGDVVAVDQNGDTWLTADPAPATSWTKVSPAHRVTPRDGAAMAFDAATGQVVLFGGQASSSMSSSGALDDDTWTWDGQDWTQQATGTSPAASTSASASASASAPASASGVPTSASPGVSLPTSSAMPLPYPVGTPNAATTSSDGTNPSSATSAAPLR